MVELLLFHHALGLTEGVRGFAAELTEAGFPTHTPDLYDGRVFTTVEEGVAHAQQIGSGEIARRAKVIAEDYPQGIVYAGISLGVMAAQELAQTRPGCRGAVLLEACAPQDHFAPAWPVDVPVQIHGMDADPFFAEEGDLDAARDLIATTPQAELFLYAGDVHLFTDAGLPSFRPAAAAQVTCRVLKFLARC